MKNIPAKNRNTYWLWGVILLFVAARLCLLDTYFFWDSVATLSGPTHFLFENQFSSIAFPSNIVDDNLFTSGLLAGVWTLFGRNLVVTHLFFTGIGIALIYQLYSLCRYFIREVTAFPFIFLLVFSDPALVTQSLLIMTDLLLLLFAIMSIRYMLTGKKGAFIISLFFLSMIRERGLVLCAGIGLCYYLLLLRQNQWKDPFRLLGKAVLPFIPVFGYFLFLYLYRIYMNQSISLLRENTPWSEGRKWVDARQFIINVAVVGRFFLDNGRCFIWLVFAFLFYKYKKRIFTDYPLVWTLFGCIMLLLLLVTLPVTNPMGPRYFIIPFLLFSFVSGLLIFRTFSLKRARIICILLVIGLWSGHYWVHPERLSVAWDTTLAHLPYYQLRKDALQYIDDQQINYADISSFFPATAEGKYIELNNDERKFAPQDFLHNKYVIYSNIANWNDEEIERIQEWPIEKEFRKNHVFIRICKNPTFSLSK